MDKGNLLQPSWPLLGKVKTAGQGCDLDGSCTDIPCTSSCVFVMRHILLNKGHLQAHSMPFTFGWPAETWALTDCRLLYCSPWPLGLLRTTISLFLATTFSHSSSYYESKNTWANPHHLHLTLLFHFSVIVGITSQKLKYPPKTLFAGPSAILRPLHTSNVARIYILKWSHNLIWAYRSCVFDLPNFFLIACFACIFPIFEKARKRPSISPNQILRPLNNRYFCHTTIAKWSQNCTRTIRKCFFRDILF